MKKSYRALCLILAAFFLCFFYTERTSLAADASQEETYEASGEVSVEAADTQGADPSTISTWPQGPELLGEAGVLIDARTGTVLFAKNADEALYPASITKLMTALLTLENASLSEVVTFSREAVFSIEADSSNIAVTEGEQLTVEQCMYALLLQSANEVANGLAEHVAGGMDAFAEMMNNRAAQLGCTNTHFVNAHGLHNENHYTTCHDMALIMKALVHNDTFIRICAAGKYTIEPTNKQPDSRYLVQKHKMLYDSEYTYEGTVAGKTGYTPEAGNTLVTYAVRGDMELIAVSMKTNWTHYDDTIAMFEFGFNNFTAYNMAEAKENTGSDFLSSSQGVFDTSSASLELSGDSWIILPNNMSLNDVESSLTLSTASASNVLANVTYSYQGVRLGSGSLLLIDSADKHFDFKEHETAQSPSSAKEKPSQNSTLFINVWILLAVILCGAIIYFLVLFIRRKRAMNRSVIKVRNSRRTSMRRHRRRQNVLRSRNKDLDRR
ncbi:D-alanyl-D-alanine carboxypeptidase [Lacrimispora sp. NSJ-141]|uniref:D-alanyl-D-alanine carboxypeptidase n=1 Tax=Lientehia hominis TaxID=2897778 RepID=A0AAP2W8B1_9FIRM|nr:D-alanyl-D-alanine carboxypeptidase family protein [Lientehia hominis]MCD2493303.1 D-alanyl-D-alanine carboxypeptidase [Lientehia hominis]